MAETSIDVSPARAIGPRHSDLKRARIRAAWLFGADLACACVGGGLAAHENHLLQLHECIADQSRGRGICRLQELPVLGNAEERAHGLSRTSGGSGVVGCGVEHHQFYLYFG